jgi:hypothetical protein
MDKELMIQRAMRFYREAEAPSEDDMELLFRALIERDAETIEDLIGART